MPKPSRRGKVILTAVSVIAVLAIAWLLFTNYFTDWMWFSSVNKTEVFRTSLITRLALFAIFGLVMGAGLAAIMWWAYRTRPTFRGLTPEQASLERYRLALEPARKPILIAVGLITGVLAGISAAGQWQTYLLWRNATPFGIKDPQFGVDLSFFTFTLPFIRFVLDFGFSLLFLALLLAVAVQYLYGGLRLQPKGQRATAAAQVQISVLMAAVLLLKAVSYWFDRYSLATQDQSVVTGFTGLKYTDVHAVLPSLTILTFVALLVAALFIVNIFRRHWVLPALGIGLMFATSIVIGTIYPMVVQQFQVRPSELVRETPYIQRNINATRAAYDVASAKVTDYPGSVTPPSVQVLRASTGTLSNIRLLDPMVVSATFNQLQQIRGYYSFADQLAVDRYNLGGTMRGAAVAVREINLAGIPTGQRNWTNDKTIYTHGYGVVSAYDNTALSNGQPDFFMSNIPVTGSLNLAQPRVYFGQMSPDYSIVGAPAGKPSVELDYPDDATASGQKTNTYSGSGGVAMGSLFGRALFATKFSDPNILLSDMVNTDSRILWDRNPAVRVQKVAPWLTVDQEPYPVVVGGRIKWIVDGYTTSNDYPYSSRVSMSQATSDSSTPHTLPAGIAPDDNVNYMRNSVKAVVDAYDGTVTLYAWDAKDPVLATWMKAFPGTVQAASTMPADLMAHVRYPLDIFKVQRSILSRYHVTDATSFYNGTNVWNVPYDPTLSPAQVYQPPYYLTLQMPGQTAPRFSLTTTFAPIARQTLAAFMSASSAPGVDYGRIQILQLPSNTTIPGPQQVQNNFESDPIVSSQLSLLRQGGSDVTLGNLLSLPFNNGLLYVEPVYVRSNSDGYPLLRKVLVSYGSNVAMQNTLDAALTQVFGTNPSALPDKNPGTNQDPNANSTPTPTPTGTSSSGPSGGSAQAQLAKAIADADAAFRAGQQALTRGDFTSYGQAQKDLAAALQRAATAEAQISGGPAA